MNCGKCEATNPEGKNYCGDCGAAFYSNVVTDNPAASAQSQKLLPNARELTKEQKLVEVEVIEAVVTRLSNWAKLFGFFVGVPIALFLTLLSLLGYKTYSDFTRLVNSSKDEVSKKLDDAQQQVASIKDRGNVLETEYQKLELRLTNFKALDEKVGNLENTVGQIASKVGVDFIPSASLTPELRKSMEDSLSAFISYLEKVGFKTDASRVKINIDPEVENNVYYEPQKNRVTLGPTVATDKTMLLGGYANYLLNSSNKNISDSGLNSSAAAFWAFTDYFICSFTNNPIVGEQFAKKTFNKPYLRKLDQNRSFSEISNTTEPHDASEVWGGAFWEIRQTLGQEETDKLLYSTWLALSPFSRPEALVKKMLEVNQSLQGGRHSDQIRAIFVRRGLSV